MTQRLENAVNLPEEQRFFRRGLTWEQFKTIQASFEVYCLREQEYEKIGNSELLPELDLSLLNRCLLLSSPLEAIREFRQSIQQ